MERALKGESLLCGVKDFVSVDIETTGLYPGFDKIIEVAAIRYRNGEPYDSFTSLVNPSMPMPSYICTLTGITDDMLSEAPTLKIVLPQFLAFLADDIVIGHNVHFDINFLYDSCLLLGFAPIINDFIDTLRLSRRLYVDWKDHRLDTMIKNMGLKTRGLHRALNDAQICADAYLSMQSDPRFAEAIKPREKRRKYSNKLMAGSIVTDGSMIDEDSPFFGQVCVFTGTLEAMPRKEAMQIVVDIGGYCADNVTQKTNFLVLGNNDYCTTIKDGKSSKQKKAEKLIEDGADLKIIPESVFWDMLDQ